MVLRKVNIKTNQRSKTMTRADSTSVIQSRMWEELTRRGEFFHLMTFIINIILPIILGSYTSFPKTSIILL